MVDLVVGNPPYVRYENIPAEQLDYIKRTFPTFHYRADLYIPFFEKTLRLLKPGGRHCFICANRWLKNEYGRKLRRLVAKCFRLEELGFKIGIGVATGADSIFISSELPGLVESKLLLPALNAKDLRGDTMSWHKEYLLNPYTPSGELISLSRYPKAARYLESHKERLADRHVARKNTSKWYKTIDRINPQLRTEAKILLPDMSACSMILLLKC